MVECVKSKDIVNTLVQVLYATMRMVEPYTFQHGERVGGLAFEAAVGDALGFPADQLEGLRVAGCLHDIGKIAIPVEILVKTGPLTLEEFALVKTHVLRGYEMLSPFNWPWPVADVALQHHERIDGSGYPHGLTGDLINPYAKIIAVTDTVEAMVSHRPYRPGLGLDAALAVINDGRGTLYDADVVDVVTHVLTVQGFKIS